MKRVRLIAWILLLCMLTACAQPAIPVNPSVNTTGAPNVEAMVPTIKPTEPPEIETTEPPLTEPPITEPTVTPTPQDTSWVIQQPEKLSYEEYFSEDRPYAGSDQWFGIDQWLVPDGDAWKGYFLRQDYTYGLQVCLWTPHSTEGDTAIYTVPNTVEFAKWSLRGTDGTTAYMTPYSSNKDCIVAVDLLTGDREYIAEDAVITDVYYCGDVLYYGLYKDGMIQIARRYIPTGDELFYPTGQKLAPMFSISKPVSSASPITWTGVTEEMTASVISELQKSDSEFRTRPNGSDLSTLWEMEEPWIYAEHNLVFLLCYDLQNATGYRTLYQCTILPDGTQDSFATGVVDSCWYGSDMNHDHYAPDAEAPVVPVANIGDWKPFVQSVPWKDEGEKTNYVSLYQGKIYSSEGNTFTCVNDISVRELRYSNGYYAFTYDNKLIRLSQDGKKYVVLYQGEDIKTSTFSRCGDMLCIRDGTSLIQLDLKNQRYRTIFTHENLSCAYFDDENVLYIDLISGLHATGYLYDLTTGEFKEVGYRL